MGAAVKQVRGNMKTAKFAKPKRKYGSPIDRAHGREIVWNQVSEVFEHARDIENAKFIYFIGEEDDGAVKIGIAKDPIVRLRQMQTGNPRRLRVEYVLIGDRAAERLLQDIWREYAVYSIRNKGKVDTRSGTEWFTPAVREQLFPIVALAAEKQMDLIDRSVVAQEDIDLRELEDLVREAHHDAGFVLRGKDEVRLLGAVGGYVYSNYSRI